MKSIAAILIWLMATGICVGQLTIIVDEVPDYTPADGPIHIAGDFQGWDPGSQDFRLDFDTVASHYMINLQAGLGAIEFNFIASYTGAYISGYIRHSAGKEERD